MSESKDAIERQNSHSFDGMQKATWKSKHGTYDMDCYPYSFSPLLLFAGDRYFDKGYSNYNAVAKFFEPILDVDMLHNVVYDRKNMLYEDLLKLVGSQGMLVTCCIDAHFTAFQMINESSMLYYDPLNSRLMHLRGAHCKQWAIYLLLKCGYGDSQHIQDNKDHYTGSDANDIRKHIYSTWKSINKFTSRPRGDFIELDLDRWFFFNDEGSPHDMSVQMTGNTCYFQTYLFAVLCKVGDPIVSANFKVAFRGEDRLQKVAVDISRFLLEFFVKEEGKVLRPLTNNNMILDFFRYKESPYFHKISKFLVSLKIVLPDYDDQYKVTLQYFESQKVLHKYGKFTLNGAMPSSLNSKSLQLVLSTDDAQYKLAQHNYYKYRAGSFMFGFNSGIMSKLKNFCEFNALRKNQLLGVYDQLQSLVPGVPIAQMTINQYRDYYFMPLFEVGQRELVDVHHLVYMMDTAALVNYDKSAPKDPDLTKNVYKVNAFLSEKVFFSTNRQANYDKLLKHEDFKGEKLHQYLLKCFMSGDFFDTFIGLGFSDYNPKEKDVTSLTQTVFYQQEFMQRQSYRMEYEFEKECINQMARSNLRNYQPRFGECDLQQTYHPTVRIGTGYTYSKYNTLMHFLNILECYWQNPDINSIQVFGKDIRSLLATSCQKIFFEPGHTFYHYGPIESSRSGYSNYRDVDLSVATNTGEAVATVAKDRGSRSNANLLVLTERVYEYTYLRDIISHMLVRLDGQRIKSDNIVLNLSLLSLMLDFDIFDAHAGMLNIPFLQSLKDGGRDKRQLQVEVSNLIYEFDKKGTGDAVTRSKVEDLIFEASCKFLVNKGFPVQSRQFELIRELNAEPSYHQYVLLCKIYMSLCQINKSVEVDYYKVKCNGAYRIIIPQNFSRSTGEYLEQITKRYTFAERHGAILYDELALFDTRTAQPEINLYNVRFDSATHEASMVKYIEFKNVFRAIASERQYLIFIADNALLVDVPPSTSISASSSSSSSSAVTGEGVTIRINKILIEVATIWLNRAISFLPCFKYADSEDVILFASKNIHYLVNADGQYATDYYGMKHELMENILSIEIFVDLNDDHTFAESKLQDLVTESKTVLYYPDYLLQVQSRKKLINLLDMAIYLRNISFFILVLFYIRRCSVQLTYKGDDKDRDLVLITGPWRAAILYVLQSKRGNEHYDGIFKKQFFDLNKHKDMPLRDFIEELCKNFEKYQRMDLESGEYQIRPRQKQKDFLEHIICAEECFHFSEVGSGKTKVILPLLCQIFLSNNIAAHQKLARGNSLKTTLIVLVPEHLVPDARTQVYRYCLNLNFREEYRVFDDIFALLHKDVQLGKQRSSGYYHYKQTRQEDTGPQMKQIFVTSFNNFKKALTNDVICSKFRPNRGSVLVVADEVDDFLDRDKLVFNICSNKANSFTKPVLDCYFEVSRATYQRESAAPNSVDSAENPEYWQQLFDKFSAIHDEIQDASKSLNKSFGIFNEQSLRHCSTNIAYDIEGYKSLIARPYESVNRAMPGSYYSDVERTIYLTYVLLMEDIAKYDELFQQERKFISFEYWSEHLRQLDYDDLVYGHNKLSELVEKFPTTKDGLVRFLYEIVLRRMEIRDGSRSVNSIDVVFNFDCIGFTGTPFIDNYPTFSYIKERREDRIPDMIDRSFYAYSSDQLPKEEFESRFSKFQGQNSNVLVEYVPSDFIVDATDELAILEQIFEREERNEDQNRSLGTAIGQKKNEEYVSSMSEVPAIAEGKEDGVNETKDLLVKDMDYPKDGGDCGAAVGFNALVDLCGIFKRSSIHEIRDLVLRHFGPNQFHYIYHIDQVDSSDRVLSLTSDNDVQFDEEFYKNLCDTYGARLRERVFFFVDNRNVIGKDIPFQLLYQRRYGQPMFTTSVVLAHDVDDFSKIWQAMGRSRTMNETRFSIYKSGAPHPGVAAAAAACGTDEKEVAFGAVEARSRGDGRFRDIKKHALTRQLYVRNCDCKMAGNLSSIYQTLIALLNLSQRRFYYTDDIVNTFIEKMQRTIGAKVQRHKEHLIDEVLREPMTSRIFSHILAEKFKLSTRAAVRGAEISSQLVEQLLGHIVSQKYEQRLRSGDEYDDMIIFLSGEQESLMEISYTKQQQKQKQKQKNKNQDSDTMDIFDKKQQVILAMPCKNYYQYTLDGQTGDGVDLTKAALCLPISIPIFSMTYCLGGNVHSIDVYPTVQFLYSHHVRGSYITQPVQELVNGYKDLKRTCKRFLESVNAHAEAKHEAGLSAARIGSKNINRDDDERSDDLEKLQMKVVENHIRQNPLYTMAALRKGIFVIGMKDQFNRHDLLEHPLGPQIQYVADDMGFILHDRTDGGSGSDHGSGSSSSSSSQASMKSVSDLDVFGPYHIEQYMLMETLSKQEVAHNVLEYYLNNREILQHALRNYGEVQGKGFICWRFLMNQATRLKSEPPTSKENTWPPDEMD